MHILQVFHTDKRQDNSLRICFTLLFRLTINSEIAGLLNGDMEFTYLLLDRVRGFN
jgi:hypothetical protein